MSDNSPAPAKRPQPLFKPLALAPAPEVPAALSLPAAPNLYDLLIQNKLSKQTRRTYGANLKRFFRDEYGCDPDAATVLRFLAQDAAAMRMQLAEYRNRIAGSGGPNGTGLAAASVKLRLAAINALIDLGHQVHSPGPDGARHPYCAQSSKGLVQSPAARGYRDTRGPEMQTVLRLLALPDRATLRGKRDYALLRLLCDNALRRAEVCALQVADFEPSPGRIAVVGKGHADKAWITLYEGTVRSVADYLAAAGHTDGALFRNCASRASSKGAALTGDGLDDVVRTYGARIGLKLSPHKFRHFAITAALDGSGGDIREVQKFSRHKKVDTVITYDDNRSDVQGKITRRLGALLDGSLNDSHVNDGSLNDGP